MPLHKNKSTIIPILTAPDCHKAFHLNSFSNLKKEFNPIMAKTGIHNSRITCIDETALNLSYNGAKSMKKSVKSGKFFPHESNNEAIAPPKKAYFIFRLSVKNAKIARKNTTAPIYAGAATPG